MPSVSPVFVQVGSTAGITSSTWVCLSVLPLLVFPPLVFPAFPPPQATGGSVIATASKIVVNFFIFCLPFVVFIFAVRFPHRQILPSARPKQGFFLLRKQLVIDLPQGQLMDHAIADNGVPSGAGIQLGVAPLRQHPLGLIQRDAKTDADAQQPIPGRIPPPRKHLMQIDLADAGPAGQLRFGQILRFVKSRQPRQAV